MLGRQVVRWIIFCFCLLPLYSLAAKKVPTKPLPPAEIQQYVESGQYFKDIDKKTNEARAYIDRQLKYPRKGRMAIVLEVDEAALSNYATLQKTAFNPDQQAWQETYLLGQAQPISEILALYEYALKNNIAIFFVSSRPNTPEILEATARNLKTAGYNQWEELILMPESANNKTLADFKNHARKHISAQGFEILVNIGNKDADLIGGFAETRVKLPNPFYQL